MSQVVVVAIGGNALIPDGSRSSAADQLHSAGVIMGHVANLISAGHQAIVVHGNGPQVGFTLLRSELSRAQVPEVPLDTGVAETQGAIGYNLQQALGNHLRRRRLPVRVASVLTQVVVDPDDPAFLIPTKPIGPFYSKEQARQRRERDGWDVMEDSNRGWRRVVPSPAPIDIIELDAIKGLLAQGWSIICVGGGGIPVVRDSHGDLLGKAAVIDKDFASSLLARELKADVFMLVTAVEQVYLHFGTPRQQALRQINLEHLKRYIAEGHFKPGSMLPKMKSVEAYLEGGGQEAIVTNIESVEKSVAGTAGTRIIP
ncbi:MAG TPA: carbamate kinase [Candidatus Xenobia bacterium]